MRALGYTVQDHRVVWAQFGQFPDLKGLGLKVVGFRGSGISGLVFWLPGIWVLWVLGLRF